MVCISYYKGAKRPRTRFYEAVGVWYIHHVKNCTLVNNNNKRIKAITNKKNKIKKSFKLSYLLFILLIYAI